VIKVRCRSSVVDARINVEVDSGAYTHVEDRGVEGRVEEKVGLVTGVDRGKGWMVVSV
jgi:hypothetical protein